MRKRKGLGALIIGIVAAGVAYFAIKQKENIPPESTPPEPTLLTAIIHGKVTSIQENDIPIIDVKVTMTETSSDASYSNNTDINGNYLLTVPIGRYVIAWEKPSFITRVAELDISEEEYLLDMTMMRSAEEIPSPPAEGISGFKIETFTMGKYDNLLDSITITSPITMTDDYAEGSYPERMRIVILVIENTGLGKLTAQLPGVYSFGTIYKGTHDYTGRFLPDRGNPEVEPGQTSDPSGVGIQVGIEAYWIDRAPSPFLALAQTKKQIIRGTFRY